MSEPFHGVTIVESSTGTRPFVSHSQSVIFLVATAPGADADVFPLGQSVLLTNPRAAVADAGTTGTLRTALDAILEQCDPTIIVMRVDVGADAAATAANVIGTSNGGTYTGLQAARVAKARHQVVPKIIAAPGLETQAVIAAMVSVAQAVRGMVYASIPETDEDLVTRDEAALFRNGFSARELMLFWPRVLRFNQATAAVAPAPASAYAVGLRAKIDATQGWYKTISNVPINGVVGIDRDITFDMLSPNNDAGYLNGHQVCAVVHSTGFCFWGNRTTSTDAFFAFETATRTSHVLHDDAADIVAAYIDKPMLPQTVRDMLESLNARARARVAAREIMGAEYFIDAAVNTRPQLNAGQLRVGCRYTIVPPMEFVRIDLTITDEFLFDFSAQLAA